MEKEQPKWISVEQQLPKDDRTVLVWINDTENPQWSNYGLCSYIDENMRVTEVKKAPFIHKEKEDLTKILLDKFYYLSLKQK